MPRYFQNSRNLGEKMFPKIGHRSKARDCKLYPAVPEAPEVPEDPQNPEVPEDPKDEIRIIRNNIIVTQYLSSLNSVPCTRPSFKILCVRDLRS